MYNGESVFNISSIYWPWRQLVFKQHLLTIPLHVTGLCLVLSALLLGSIYFSVRHNDVFLFKRSLLTRQGDISPEILAVSDTKEGGYSTAFLNEQSDVLDMHYKISDKTEYPYVALYVIFDKYFEANNLLDWTSYHSVVIELKCSISNTLSFQLHTFDEKITRLDNFDSYRRSWSFFECKNDWQTVEIQLSELETPEWWYSMNNVEYFKKDIDFNQVLSVAIGNSIRSPRNISSNIKIRDIYLHGNNLLTICISILCVFLLMIGVTFIGFNYYRKRLAVSKSILTKETMIAYQQLPNELSPDKLKGDILRYMATSYTNSNLSLDEAVVDLGVNRTKLNEILKAELGLTFTAYLNKLRLTEAARLLRESRSSIAEVGYSVGYNNPSYFNALFKKEYGCTPRAYRKQALEEV